MLLRTPLILVLLALAPGAATAQQVPNCEELDVASEADVRTAFECIANYQLRLEALEAGMAKLIDGNTGDPRVAPDHSHAVAATGPDLPAGAVILYAPDAAGDPQEPCPPGWSFYQQAAGRFAIGAGQPQGKLSAEFSQQYGKYQVFDPASGEMKTVNLRPYRQDGSDNWLFYPLGEVGGAEEVTLSEAQMPAHDHIQVWGQLSGAGNTVADGNDLEPHQAESMSQATREAGGSDSHANMPPYIALYFCRKDG